MMNHVETKLAELPGPRHAKFVLAWNFVILAHERASY